MWQQQKKDTVIINLALLMSIATSPMVASFLISAPLPAESQTRTPLPPTASTINQNPSLLTIPTNPPTEQPTEVGNEIQLVNPFTNP
ncbi:MAG: hypothetical protein ACKN9K_13295, partial [Dolichospermum sp.]